MELSNRVDGRLGNENEKLNIGQTDCTFQLEAKTCGCKENRTVAYSVEDSYHALCIGKKEIILGACEKSLYYCETMVDRIALLGEISHLRLMLNLASLKSGNSQEL